MATQELRIGNHSYLIKGEDEEHLEQVASLVQGRMDTLVASQPGIHPTKAALLVAAELAAEVLRARAQLEAYRANLLQKAGDILTRIEQELTPSTPPAEPCP